MLANPIIPKRKRPFFPTKSALDFRVPSGFIKVIEQPAAFICRKPLKVAGESGVHIDHPQSCFGMRTDNRMMHGGNFSCRSSRDLFRRLVKTREMSCTAIKPSHIRFICSDSRSYARCIFAKHVSPPQPGTSRVKRIEPRDGFFRWSRPNANSSLDLYPLVHEQSGTKDCFF